MTSNEVKEALGSVPFRREGDLFRATSVRHLLQHKLTKRSWSDRAWFDHSWLGMSGLCAFSAVAINTLFRRQLYVYEGLLSGGLATCFISPVLNYFLHWGNLTKPMLKGDVQCGVCALGRGAYVQVMTAYLLPGAISFLLNAQLADRYKSTFIPRFDIPLTPEFKSYWGKHLRVIFKKSRPLLLLQVVAGTAVAYKQFTIIDELRKDITPEEYGAIWTNIGVK